MLYLKEPDLDILKTAVEIQQLSGFFTYDNM